MYNKTLQSVPKMLSFTVINFSEAFYEWIDVLALSVQYNVRGPS